MQFSDSGSDYRGGARGEGGVIAKTTGCVVTIASVAPDSVVEGHVRVFVPPCLLKNTARVSNASAAISPNPPGYEGPYWRPRASDIGRYAWRVPDMRAPTCPGSAPRSGVRVPSRIPIFQPSPSRCLRVIIWIFHWIFHDLLQRHPRIFGD